MSITLSEMLDLIGKLDDTPGDDTPRERFRRYLDKSLMEVGQTRDYENECLRNVGPQYNRALQDLVNCIGHFLGFAVKFGRYQGVQGQIGYDGLWQSPTGFHIVIEVKTTEVYNVKTATLMGYINQLISEKTVPSLDYALGVYVIGRPDPEIRQLENTIKAEKRADQLRIISVESLLSLADMMSTYGIKHSDVMAVIGPSGPTIDPIVEMMNRLVCQTPPVSVPEPNTIAETVQPYIVTKEEKLKRVKTGEGTIYWLTPVSDDPDDSAEETIDALVGKTSIYAFGDRTPGRSHIKPGDWICFYAQRIGIVAHAKIASFPEQQTHPKVHHPEKYTWIFQLTDTKLYLKSPIVVDAQLRKHPTAFAGRDIDKSWAWFVQGTHTISEEDFRTLTNS